MCFKLLNKPSFTELDLSLKSLILWHLAVHCEWHLRMKYVIYITVADIKEINIHFIYVDTLYLSY